MCWKKLSERREFCQNLVIFPGLNLECEHHFPFAMAEQRAKTIILECRMAVLECDPAYSILLKCQLLGSYCGHMAVFSVLLNCCKTNNHKAISTLLLKILFFCFLILTGFVKNLFYNIFLRLNNSNLTTELKT